MFYATSGRKLFWLVISLAVVLVLNLSFFGLLSLKESMTGPDSITVAVDPDAPLQLQLDLQTHAQGHDHPVAVMATGLTIPITNQPDGPVDLYITSTPESFTGAHEVYPLFSEDIVVVVHPLNPLHRLSLQQLHDLTTGKVTNWSQIGGADQPVVWLTLPEGSRSSQIFAETVGAIASANHRAVADLAELKEELRLHVGAIATIPQDDIGSPAQPVEILNYEKPVYLSRVWYAVVPKVQQSFFEKVLGLDKLLHQSRVQEFVNDFQLRKVFQPDNRRLTLAAVGDVMLGRRVTQALETKGYDYPFAATLDKLLEADLRFSNLESPLGTTGTPIPGKGIWYRARPEAIESIIGARMDIVNLANNHILDYDTPLLLETLAIMEQANIPALGVGLTLEDAIKPVIIEQNGLRIGFIGYSDMAEIFWDYSYPRTFAASETTPGVAPLREGLILQGIAELQPLVDVVIVSLHWGEEYVNHPTAEQQRMARGFIDAGADLILGHHAHAIQGVEFYKDGVIAYSLGNFITDQEFDHIVRESMILTFTLGPKGVIGTEYTPVFLTDFQPRILTGEPGAQAVSKMIDISQDLYSNIK